MLTKRQIDIVERLRGAAREHGEVVCLLEVLSETILLDGLGNREIIGDDEAIGYLETALVAAGFVAYDREPEAEYEPEPPGEEEDDNILKDLKPEGRA